MRADSWEALISVRIGSREQIQARGRAIRCGNVKAQDDGGMTTPMSQRMAQYSSYWSFDPILQWVFFNSRNTDAHVAIR